jgi:basic membrane protein A
MTISAPDYADVYLTSALKKMDVTVFDVIKKSVDGTFQGGTYLGTLENDGVGLAPFHQLASIVPAELQAELDEIKQGIIAGEIETTPTVKSIKVGLLTDLGQVDDNSFNETAWNGILKAQEQLGIEVVYRESYEESEWEPNMNALIEDEGCDLIVTMGFFLADVTAAAAQANPDTKFAIVDFSYDPVIDNVVGIEYAIDEACFLAGYLAAGVTKTGVIATYGGMDIPPVTLFMDGFALGAQYYNQKYGTDVGILGWDPATQTGLFVDTFTDVDAGRRMGESLMVSGADIILPICGLPGMGTASVAQERGDVYVMGVDTDMTMSAPDYANVYLTSTLKKMDVTVFDVIKQVVDDTFQGGTYLGTLANDGVGLAPFHELASMVPDDLQDELDEINQGIISGGIPTNPRETPEKDYSNVFFMPLASGLNMVSLPLKPRTEYTARSLAEEMGATVVIRHDAELGKFVGFDLNGPGAGFPIKGGEGYIVNVPGGGTFVCTGAAWTNEPPVATAPPAQTSDAWAFVVSGLVFDGEGMNARNGGYTATVRNLQTGEILTEAVGSDGYFAAAWADLNRKAVIGSGDKVEVAVLDSIGSIVSGPFIHDITLDAIREAVVNVHLKLGDITPVESSLLQNYPNPFNPETWIPYHLSVANPVVIKIHNASGQLVRTLDLGHRDAGIYTSRSTAAYWDGRNEAGEAAASGIYFYSLTIGDSFSAMRKMIIRK